MMIKELTNLAGIRKVRFNFCPVCGSFDDHYVGEDDIEYSCGEFATVTESELLKLINDFEETDDCYIEYYGDAENV